MDTLTQALISIALMLIMLNTGLPIALSLGVSASIVGAIATGLVSFHKLGWTTFQSIFVPAWTPLPLFVFMGCLIAQTRIGEDLFRSARLWLSRLPGGLIVAAVLGQAGIAAVLGSAAPTILAIGAVALPELERYKYDKKLSLGAITCGGALGPLIPPSAMAIIISGLAGEYVPLARLLIAGIVPGILLAVLLSLVPIIKCTIDPSLGPAAGAASWADRFKSLRRVWPVALTFFCVIAVIFFGIATATEAGAIGALATLIISIFVYNANWKNIHKALRETVTVNAQLMFIIVGATFFTYIVGSSTIAKQMTAACANIGSPILVVVIIQAIILFLGCVLDLMTIMMVTIPLVFPLIISLGLDPIWFAVLFMVNMEAGMITPPMGVNFFLVRNVFDIPSKDLFQGVLPYMIMIIVFLAILVIFPSISTWLPGMMFAG
jgi:C4-dicarboxylate transporter DctM subunit